MRHTDTSGARRADSYGLKQRHGTRTTRRTRAGARIAAEHPARVFCFSREMAQSCSWSGLLTALLVSTVSRSVNGIDNGLGIVPARGWRSWNEFGDDINQATIEAQMEALASRKRTVGGVPTSLADLGFRDAGIDDGWQMCNSGPGGNGFHNASGYPIVNESRFPDLRAMTAKANSLGLTAGWCESPQRFCAYTAVLLCRIAARCSVIPSFCFCWCTRWQQLHLSRSATSMPVRAR